jgi:hypothetical protein
MQTAVNLTEADILEKIVSPKESGLSPDAAQFFLSLKFDSETIKKIRTLLRKNNRGTISAPERISLEKYLRVGQFLDLVRAKAKVSLNRAKETT